MINQTREELSQVHHMGQAGVEAARGLEFSCSPGDIKIF